MEDQIILKGKVEKKSRVLQNPNLYSDVPMVMLRIPRDYLPGLIEFTKDRPDADWEVTLKLWPVDPTERAKNLFFALRDRLAVASGGEPPPGQTNTDYKYHLYKECIRSCNFGKESIKDLDKKELWILTSQMKDWCIDAECYLGDLMPEYKSIKEKINDLI